MSQNQSEIKKIENGRAEFAYKCVDNIINNNNNKILLKEYRSHSRKIPQMIISNGLGQTLAFIQAKRKNYNAYDFLYRQIQEYFLSNNTIRIRMNNAEDLLEWVISCNSEEYKYITQETLAFFNWLRRFAEGMIEDEEE